MAIPFQEWYSQMPIVTKTYATACVLTTLAVHIDIISTFDLYLNFYDVFYKGQVWRLLTNFLFFDYFSLNFVFHMFFLIRHSQSLEENSFRGRTADYVFMWLFGAVNLLLIDAVFFAFQRRLMFLSSALSFMAVYVWSRRNQHTQMSFLGLFTFRAPYLPWVILAFGMLLDQSPLFDLLGIAVGHLYFYLEDVYPTITGRRLLRSPHILKVLFDAPAAVGPPPNANNPLMAGGPMAAADPDE